MECHLLSNSTFLGSEDLSRSKTSYSKRLIVHNIISQHSWERMYSGVKWKKKCWKWCYNYLSCYGSHFRVYITVYCIGAIMVIVSPNQFTIIIYIIIIAWKKLFFVWCSMFRFLLTAGAEFIGINIGFENRGNSSWKFGFGRLHLSLPRWRCRRIWTNNPHWRRYQPLPRSHFLAFVGRHLELETKITKLSKQDVKTKI